MKTKKSLFLLVGSVFFVSSAMAQTTFTGDIQQRTEFRNGYQTPMDSTAKPASFISQRTRLIFGHAGDNFKVRIAVQDVSVWGNQSQAVSAYTSTGATTFICQAWGQYFFLSKWSIKTGRQELSYDDERLLGAVDWLQQGRTHDAALLVYEDTTNKLTVHGGVAYNASNLTNTAVSYTVTNSYKTMQHLWVNKKFGSLTASVILVNLGYQSPLGTNQSRTFQTFGTYLEYKKNALFISGRFYDQTSAKYSSATFSGGKKIQGWMAGADVQYTFAEHYIVGIGGEMMTGQSSTDTITSYKEINHAFNPLFGTAHKFNGYMDYYFTGSAHNNEGLRDLYAKFKYKTEKWWAGINLHMFAATAEVLDKKNLSTNGTIKAMDSNLGSEVDFTLAYQFSKTVAIHAGYSHYFLTETTSAVKNLYRANGTPDTRQTANWAFLTLKFKPVFLK